jgi:hypothetical protein
MIQINYIKQLTAVMEKFIEDDNLNPSHISLYIALFQYWNLNRFSNPVSICRGEIMKLSKIGSNSTYHRCIKQLHQWNYLEYLPSYNPFKGSEVNMFNFCTSSEQDLAGNHPINGQALVSSKTYINNKQFKLKLKEKKIEEIEIYFLEKKRSKLEAQNFFNYYEAIDWKVGGKNTIKNWEAVANNWILNAKQIKPKRASTPPVQKQDNLKTTKIKDYGEPL